ncbi:ArnT family glycosyltransferase [Candidatus Omnitrophota bacterium]
MKTNNIKNLYLSHKKTAVIFISLFFLAIIVRFPYFFYSIISWDESTYIIMGQDLLDGNLPYAHLWENKSPLVFLFYALFILLFGKSIVAVRLGGLLCVFISSCVIYKVGKHIYGRTAGFWGAILTVVYSSTFIDGQATMTEHILLLPMSLILWCILTKKRTNKNTFFTGLLLGIAILIRMNMIYSIIAIIVALFLDRSERDIFRPVRNFFILLSGILAPFIAIAGIYLFNNSLDLLVKTVRAALAFASYGKPGFWELTLKAGNEILNSFLSLNILIWIVFLCGIIIVYIRSIKQKDMRSAATIISAFFLTVLLSIIKTGRVFPHYLIQLVPFMAIIGGVGLSFIFSSRRMWNKGLASIVLVIGLSLSLIPTTREYGFFLKKARHYKPLFMDMGYYIAYYLNSHDVSGQYVFLCSHHIGYWLTGAKIPTKYAHPSNLGKEYLLKAIDGKTASSESALQNILMKKPVFIVKPLKVDYFNKGCNAILDTEIERRYELDEKIGPIDIYKRKAVK